MSPRSSSSVVSAIRVPLGIRKCRRPMCIAHQLQAIESKHQVDERAKAEEAAILRDDSV